MSSDLVSNFLRSIQHLNIIRRLMSTTEENSKRPCDNIYKFIPYQLEEIKDYASEVYAEARSGHRIVCTERNLYVIGGYNPKLRQSLLQQLWKYNFLTKQWKLCLDWTVKEMPEEVASNAVALKNNIMFTFGGTGHPFGHVCSNHCHVFKLDKTKINVFKVGTKGDLPEPRYGSAIFIHESNLYIVGGTSGFNYFCDIYRLNLVNKQWECIFNNNSNNPDTTIPSGRYRHEIVYSDRLIFILGGGTNETSFDLSILPAFDLDTKSWQFVKTKPDTTVIDHCDKGFPKARKCHSCVHYDTDDGIEVVISGGVSDEDEEDNEYCDDIWKLNLKTLQWKLLTTVKLPKPLYFHSAATSGNGCMYIFGGIEYDYGTLKRTNHLYKIWTKIPKLSDMCWDAVCYYNPNLFKYTKDELLKFGIPRKLISNVLDNF